MCKCTCMSIRERGIVIHVRVARQLYMGKQLFSQLQSVSPLRTGSTLGL